MKNSFLLENYFSFNKNRIKVFINHLNWLPRNAILALISFLSPYEGQVIVNKIIKYSNSSNLSNTLMILTEEDKVEFSIISPQIQKYIIEISNKDYFINKAMIPKIFYSVGNLISSLNEIGPGKKLLNSGQIILNYHNNILLRKGQPMLSSSQGIFYIWNGDFVSINAPLMTLLYKKMRTGDIVQGIPKIEYFFEARKNTKSSGEFIQIHLSNKLLIFFIIFRQKSTLHRAVQRSFSKIQKIIIDGISRVYCSQGIIISRKHFEIIVKQMTSKVKILDGGETGLLEGEFVNLVKIEKINKSLVFKRIRYEPLLLGITRVSLKMGSFISSASFQETTKVLSQAALERKIDFLNGLKENVILGHLIYAGTGLIIQILSKLENED